MTRELSPRQRQVLAALTSGASNKVIARNLGVEAATVKTHVAALLRHYGAANRTQLAVMASKQ